VFAQFYKSGNNECKKGGVIKTTARLVTESCPKPKEQSKKKSDLEENFQAS
jgi:hypothetical protein